MGLAGLDGMGSSKISAWIYGVQQSKQYQNKNSIYFRRKNKDQRALNCNWNWTNEKVILKEVLNKSQDLKDDSCKDGSLSVPVLV